MPVLDGREEKELHIEGERQEHPQKEMLYSGALVVVLCSFSYMTCALTSAFLLSQLVPVGSYVIGYL